MSLEMYGKELDQLELNELFYEQPSEAVKIFGTEVFNYNSNYFHYFEKIKQI